MIADLFTNLFHQHPLQNGLFSMLGNLFHPHAQTPPAGGGLLGLLGSGGLLGSFGHSAPTPPPMPVGAGPSGPTTPGTNSFTLPTTMSAGGQPGFKLPFFGG